MNAAHKQQKISPLPSSSSSSPTNASSQSAGGGSVGIKNETLATASSSTGALGDRDVGDIVLKAKRAAASLWMVLHAQSCSLSNAASSPGRHAPGGRHRQQPLCPHRGCDDMKRLLRHIRGCPASFDQLDCPRDYPGCCSVRKLMAHHKRCRALRLAAFRRQSPSCTSSFPSPPPPCLICSLVARHARNILEGGSAPSPPSAQQGRDRYSRPRSASASVSVPIPSGSCTREDDSVSMPPPPPRRPRAASDIPFGNRSQGRNDAPRDIDDTIAGCSSSCSPPNESHLMRNRQTRKIWTALASATGPAPCVGGGLLEHSPDLLSRSFDSSSSSRQTSSCRVVVTPPAKRRMGSSPLRGVARGTNNTEGKALRSDYIPSLCTENDSSKENASLSSQPVTSTSPSSAEREGSRKRRPDQPSPATMSQQRRPRSKSEGGQSSPPPTSRVTAVNVTETRHHQDDGAAIENPMQSMDGDGAATSAKSAATLLSFHRRSRSFSELEESHIWSDHQHHRSSYRAVYLQEEEAASELHLSMDASGGREGGGFGTDACRGRGDANDVEGHEGEETGGGGGASLSMTRRSSSCGVLSALAPPE